MAVICDPNGHKFLFTNEHTIFTPFVPYSMQKLFLSSVPHDLNFRETMKNARGAPGFLKLEALVKTEDPERVARAISRFDDIKVRMHFVPVNFPGMNFHKACKAAAIVNEELISVICEKKATMCRGELMLDIVSHMIMALDASGKGSEVEIVEKILGFGCCKI
ncbi:hypothetical protein Patl1_11651 [Pistacia atlantica]|uniref:Uncharacterized protein n=1 Tax=Pistacia atlantica TaxID=434234 RepID=A0ACC1A9M8_9ROSI|nr:hypothetical protein Patl1_11651 [Pistacia atlantica]